VRNLASATKRYFSWIPLPGLSRLSGSASPEQKRIFAIVLPTIPTRFEGKTMRRIVIFDNHPESLRLVLQSDVDDVAETRSPKRGSAVRLSGVV
jgi:hypothetical protein